MNNLNNKEALETENSKLDYTINEIQKITSKYCSMQTDEIKINRAREISTEQEFRVIQIRKSIDHFLIEYFPEADLVSTCSKSSENHKESKLKAISSLTFPYQDTEGPNLNLSAVVNNPVVEAYSSPLEPHEVPPRPDNLEPKFKFQQHKLDEINKTLDFEIQKLERKINKTKIQLEQETSKRSEVASMRKCANFDLKSNPILDRKSVRTPKTVKIHREIQNPNTRKSSPLNTQDFATQYSTSSSFKSETVDQFIDNLVEGKETELSYDGPPFSIQQCLNQEFESKQLPPIELRRFNGNPIYWPEFIENFKSRVHFKPSFNDNIGMEKLLSVLDGDTKRSVEVLDTSGIFYATALNCLKRDYGNPLVIAHLRFKTLFGHTQLKLFDRSGLRQFHEKLKTSNTWLLSIGYELPLL